MARVDVQLQPAQVPDERTGPPRVTRLVNCQYENGTIRKSRGSVAVTPGTLALGDIPNVCAFETLPNGTSFVVGHSNISSDPSTVYTRENDVSDRYRTPDASTELSAPRSYVESDECPRVISVFTELDSHYENCGVITTGDGTVNSEEYVVVAQALPGYDSDAQWHASSEYPEIVWAKVAGTPRRVVLRGKVGPLTDLQARRPHLACSEKFVAYYSTNEDVVIAYWVPSLQSMMTLCTIPVTLDASTSYASANIDISYDSYSDRILLVTGNGAWWLIRGSDGAVMRNSSVTAATKVDGTFGVGYRSSAAYPSGVAWFSWLTTAATWVCEVWAISDAAATITTAAFVVTTSTAALVHPSYFRYQASVTPWMDPAVTPDAYALLGLWHRNSAASPVPIAVTSTVRPVSIAAPMSLVNYRGFDTRYCTLNSAPSIRKVTIGVVTAYLEYAAWCNTQGRTLRNAILLKRSARKYNSIPVDSGERYAPRMTASAFRGGTSPPTPLLDRIGHLNPSVYGYVTPIERGTLRRGWLTAMLRLKDAAGTGCNVHLVEQAVGTDLFTTTANLPDVLQIAVCRDSALVASALPGQVTDHGEDAGMQYPPPTPYLEGTDSGAAPVAGSYNYVVVREWVDSAGNLHRSPPSDPVNATIASPTNIGVYFSDDPWLYSWGDSRMHVYRTQSNGSVYYRISPACGISLPGLDTFVTTGYLLDSYTDAQIASNPILYTQAERGGLSGMLEWWGPPGCRCIWGGIDRACAGGLENENRVQFSNLYYPGEGVSWPENEAFFVDLPTPVTAVLCLDGTWLAASKSSILAITGQGPDAFGQGTFDAPRSISVGIGVRSWRSVVETPAGIFFQAEDRQIYLIQRGSFQVTLASAAIRDSIGQTPPSHATLDSLSLSRTIGVLDDVQNWIRSAVLDRAKGEVWFSEALARDWVLTLADGSWRSEVSTAIAGAYCVGGGTVQTYSYAYYGWGYLEQQCPVVIRRTVAGVQSQYRPARTWDDPYKDFTGGLRRMGVFLSDVDVGHGRLRRAWVNVDRAEEGAGSAGVVTVRARASVWFDGKRGELAPDEYSSVTHNSSSTTANQFQNLEFCFARQKCNEFRFAYFDDPLDATYGNLSWHITSIVLDVDGLNLKQQRNTSVSRGA